MLPFSASVFYQYALFELEPATCFLIHQFIISLLSTYFLFRCNSSNILLEMDRMLRPGGRAFFRDNKLVIEEINHITDAMGWRCNVGMTEEGPYANRRLLMCEKLL